MPFDGQMPRHIPRYLEMRARKGGNVWYVRTSRDAPRIRLTAEYGTPEFLEQYRAALVGQATATKPMQAHKGSLRWLFNKWRESSNWKMTAQSTQKQRENIIANIIEKNGDKPFAQVLPRDILAGRERRMATPFAANNYLKAMRALFEWAVEVELMKANPASPVAFLPRRTDGHEPWTDADIDAYRAHWPLGTRQRVAFETIYETGLRRGDAVKLGRQHIGKDGMGRIVMEKTGKPAVFLVTPDLQAAWDAGPTGDMIFIVTSYGQPYKKEGFGNLFREWCDAAGVTKSAHGLRKTNAGETAEAGASDEELMAGKGWTTSSSARVYTRGASQTKLAKAAGEKRLQHKRIPPH